ncbi:hypothetical protein PUNSTDRAFT_133156 [Punctularia strigosozonata HHB-11173 SS5]|uniref:uncharacterized protein n=1 Tax=Punctularia strigosozonata (strain HHB-11173) TaxID=741275 RepID=UPI0004417115|nr:uncharacterized protein PUNSTDRAFT_133156 [Punctularia strigosozonata HHB-11173 SS5]EIN11106.1 hypothetical protein PUNSTDRAFT_133156 [Punctularia strigosozonata HHB-11173 SS5]
MSGPGRQQIYTEFTPQAGHGTTPAGSSGQGLSLVPVPQDAPESKAKSSSTSSSNSASPVIPLNAINANYLPLSLAQLLPDTSVPVLARVLQNYGLPAFPPGTQKASLRIRWPGYTSGERTLPFVLSGPGGPASRADVVRQIAKIFSQVYEKLQYDTPFNKQWRLGPSAISMDDVYLANLRYVSQDIWQCDFLVAVA